MAGKKMGRVRPTVPVSSDTKRVETANRILRNMQRAKQQKSRRTLVPLEKAGKAAAPGTTGSQQQQQQPQQQPPRTQNAGNDSCATTTAASASSQQRQQQPPSQSQPQPAQDKQQQQQLSTPALPQPDTARTRGPLPPRTPGNPSSLIQQQQQQQQPQPQPAQGQQLASAAGGTSYDELVKYTKKWVHVTDDAAVVRIERFEPIHEKRRRSRENEDAPVAPACGVPSSNKRRTSTAAAASTSPAMDLFDAFDPDMASLARCFGCGDELTAKQVERTTRMGGATLAWHHACADRAVRASLHGASLV